MVRQDPRKNRRMFITVLVIFFLMYANSLFLGPLPKVCLNALIWATYTRLLMIPKSSWSKKRLWMAAIIIIIENAAGLYWFHEMNLIYFLAIVTLSFSMQLTLTKSFVPVMVAILVTAMLYIRFGREDFFSIIPFILLSIVLYSLIRSRMQRNQLYELDKLHLEQLQKAYDQLQEASVTAMQYAVLEERTRIAREIHDAVGHSLTSLIVKMQAVKYMIKKDPEEAEQSIEGMLLVARQGLQDIRISVHSLADDRSQSGIIPLKALLSRMETSTNIHYEFYTNLQDEDTTAKVNGILFRVLQEAITNIIRHSQAAKVNVTLVREAEMIVFRIQDNGILDTNHRFSEGFGLKVMKARLTEAGGTLHYSILEPHGFEIRAEIPEKQAGEKE